MSGFTCSTLVTKARKQRRCHWCGERIEIGQSYVRIAGQWDGDFGVSSWHPECDAVFLSLTWQEREAWDLSSSFDAAQYKRGSKEPRL